MAIVAPFKGITYNWKSYEDPSVLVAPPYDVISEEEQDQYYLVHPHNIIRLILGKKKTGDSDWDNRYTRAAEYFKRWLEEGVLVREKEPCIYLTSVTFQALKEGPWLKRWGIIALVRIEDPESKVILPHERTFSAHKEDRLRLMRACNAQFSQIFGLFEDGNDHIIGILREFAERKTPLRFTFKDQTQHEVFVIKDAGLISSIYEEFLDKKILIADGHHRYETSRYYRNIMRTKYNPRPSNRSYEYTMMYLTNMLSDGLLILPTHRLLTTAPITNLEQILKGLVRFFEIEIISDNNLALLTERLREAGKNTTAFLMRQRESKDSYLLRLKNEAYRHVGDDLDPALRTLDVVILSRLVFQKVLGFGKEDMDREEVFHYTSDANAAFNATASRDYFMAVLMNPTRIGQVMEVAHKALVMPRKSTFFYPKVLSGLVLNKIDPYEIVYVPEAEY